MSYVDVRPLLVTLRLYEGNPTSVRVFVDMPDGSPADVADWVWAAWISTTPPTPFECFSHDDGVTIYLRGEDSMGLPGQWWRFDVSGRDPGAGESQAVVRGELAVTPRVTQRLVTASA
jgi:hypothetical protein